MKKLLLVSLGVICSLMTVSSYVVASSADGGECFVSTKCVVKKTGQVLGPSNNCKPGNGSCCDNDCSSYIKTKLSIID